MASKVGWVYHDDFLKHDTGPSHPERPQRLEAVVAGLEKAGLISRMAGLSFGPVDPAVPAWLHEPAYVELLRQACESQMGFVGSNDTTICPRSYDLALLAVGGTLAAVDAVQAGKINKAFCAVRPPGHHAEKDKAMGFCLLNNVALAAEHLIRRGGLSRVAIVDFDVHHGNGTQHVFQDRDDVFFVSIHEHPHFLFPGTGFAHETGFRQGQGYTVNLPMLPGADDEAYRRAFKETILPRLLAYQPQFLLVSAGFDAVSEDPLADIELKRDAFGWLTADLAAVAAECCAGKMVSVLEGGYHLEALAECAAIHVQAMLES